VNYRFGLYSIAGKTIDASLMFGAGLLPH